MIAHLRDGKRHPTANVAFRTGEALHDLAAPTCGYSATYLAGNAAEVGRALIMLAKGHALSALALYTGLPVLGIAETADDETFRNTAARLMLGARAEAGDHYVEAWERRAQADCRFAARLDAVRGEDDSAIWFALLEWASVTAAAVGISGGASLGLYSLSLRDHADRLTIEALWVLIDALLARLDHMNTNRRKESV
jgi:hypothetical protein